tara:strand:- start:446 stop:928 length:483 start_codon:yes stop_codon:yes gene_type:complete
MGVPPASSRSALGASVPLAVVGVLALANACPHPPNFLFFGVASLVGVGVLTPPLTLANSPLSNPLEPAPVKLPCGSNRIAGGLCWLNRLGRSFERTLASKLGRARCSPPIPGGGATSNPGLGAAFTRPIVATGGNPADPGVVNPGGGGGGGAPRSSPRLA